MTPLIYVDRDEGIEAPDDDSFSCWVRQALLVGDTAAIGEAPEISVRIAHCDEVASLNQQYRGKSGPTNVLSFTANLPEVIESQLLGDIVLCAPIIDREAAEQGKPTHAHWAHLTVHGVLHLRGYDHINDTDAGVMEALEIEALAALEITNPYQLDLSSEGGSPTA